MPTNSWEHEAEVDSPPETVAGNSFPTLPEENHLRVGNWCRSASGYTFTVQVSCNFNPTGLYILPRYPISLRLDCILTGEFVTLFCCSIRLLEALSTFLFGRFPSRYTTLFLPIWCKRFWMCFVSEEDSHILIEANKSSKVTQKQEGQASGLGSVGNPEFPNGSNDSVGT